ncbi:MAG: response regulator [Archangium sp.]|nr:response regulator [Archangium sp.]
MKRIDGDADPRAKAPTQLVLYVEDEPSNWEVTELRLRKKFKLLWARTDQEACALVRHYGPELHAILMDVQLQGSSLDGLALTRLFRGKASGPVPEFAQGIAPVTCPIFFVTAYGNLHSPQEMDAAGGDAHVPKPVDFLKLTLLLARNSMKRAMDTLKG